MIRSIETASARKVSGSARHYVSFGVFLTFLSVGTLPLAGEPELERKIFAHHMGSLNVGRGAMAWMAENPNLGDPRYSSGGDYRNYALAPREVSHLSLEESADLQIRRAMAIGINGFAMDAWAGGNEAKDFLDALFKVAEENDYPFELSICPDINTLAQPNGFTAAFVEAVRHLLDRHGDSPKLARRNGKPIIFGYLSIFVWTDYLWEKYGNQEDVDRMRTTPEGWATIGNAFRRIEEMVGQELYFQFDFGGFFFGVQQHVPDHLYAEAAAAVARQLPAVNQFLPDRHTMNIAQAVVAEGTEWGHPVYMNYENNRTQHARGGPGTGELRQRWEEAREVGSSLIQISTWNDYQENTNISPGTTTRYAYYDLTGYFIDWWKSGSPPFVERDKVYLFSRRYGEGATVFPFRDRYYHPGAIEVLTILREPAVVSVPGRGAPYAAPAGLHAQQFPVTPGPLGARVLRGGIEVLSLDHPEPVSSRPFRQDNGIVAISSECERYWQQEWGDAPGLRNAEYGDDDGDGLPNWFEMYWFGEFNNYSTATFAGPLDIANEEELTNLEAYLQQKSPVGGDFEPEDKTGPFYGDPAPIPGIVQAEDYDHGGQGIAYNDTSAHNQGGAYRRYEGVDIQVTDDVGGGFNVGWINATEWIQYTVNVETSGYYEIRARVASPFDGRYFHLEFDGEDATGPIHVPQTGGWQAWETTNISDVWLDAGVRTMRVRMDTGDYNINYIEFVRATETCRPFHGDAARIPGRIRASDFDLGGQYVAYFDVTDHNQGGIYRPGEFVDLEPASDEGGGYNIGWTLPAEWVIYTVDVESDGVYDLKVRVATPDSGRYFYIDFDGAEVSGRIDVPNTGGWQNWTTVVVPAVSLKGGEQQMRVRMGSGNFNLNYVDVSHAAEAASNTFEAWAESWFTPAEMSDLDISGDRADPDGDGVANLMEYALGENPQDSSRDRLPRETIVFENSEKYLAIEYTRPAGRNDVVYEVEVSDDLREWKSGEDHVVTVSVTPSGTNEAVVVRDRRPMHERQKRYLRLNVRRAGGN